MQKEYMLKKNREFRYVCSRGASVSDRYLVLLTVKNRMGLKVGFSVGKKSATPSSAIMSSVCCGSAHGVCCPIVRRITAICS